MSCVKLHKVPGGWVCGNTLCAISRAACIACRSRREQVSTLNIRDHPHIVHAQRPEWNAEILLRVAAEPPSATVPYK